MHVTTKTISFPIRNDEGKVRDLGRIECDTDKFFFTDDKGWKYTVVLKQTSVRRSNPPFEHRALAMRDVGTDITLFYFLPSEGDTRVLEPRFSGGLSMGPREIGTLTGDEAIDFVHRHMNG